CPRVAHTCRPPPPVLGTSGGCAFDDAPSDSGAWRGFPAAELVVPRVMLVRRGGRTHLVATAIDADPRELSGVLARARAALLRPFVTLPPSVTFHALGAPAATWRRAVEATLDDIANGRLAKLVLARACSVRTTEAFDPLRVLARLRSANPGCTIFGIAHGTAMFVGASPERLARVTGRRLDTAAVAGTAPRGMTGHRFASNPKERAEHAFVVDGIVRELGGVSDYVVAASAPRVLTTETLRHLHTPIRALLRPGHGLLDAVQRCTRRRRSAVRRARSRAPPSARASGSPAAGTPAASAGSTRAAARSWSHSAPRCFAGRLHSCTPAPGSSPDRRGTPGSRRRGARCVPFSPRCWSSDACPGGPGRRAGARGRPSCMRRARQPIVADRDRARIAPGAACLDPHRRARRRIFRARSGARVPHSRCAGV